jgi:parvulin-like peptidyl-prolyl isomerase
MIKKAIAIIFALALIPVWVGCGGLPQNAVAEVNGKVITREDLDRRLDLYREIYAQQVPDPNTPEYEEFEKRAAAELVDEQIIAFEAEEMDLSVTEEELNEEIDRRKEQAGGEEEYEKLLEERDTTIDREMEQMRIDLLFQKLYPEVVKDSPKVSDEAVRQYYDENVEQFVTPTQSLEVEHILVNTKEEADQVIVRLDAGEDFGELARELSQDASNAELGGSLGIVPGENSGFVPEFEAAMNQLAEGETSGPVQTDFGFHIIRVVKIIPPGPTPFEDVKDSLKQQLQTLDIDYDFFGRWLREARDKYEIIWAEGFEPDEEDTQTGTATTEAIPAPAPAPNQ